MSYKKISELNTPNSINGDAKFVFIQNNNTLAGGPDLIKNYIQNSSLNLSPQSPTASTSTNTGTLTVSGGVGVSGRVTATNMRCMSTAPSNSPLAGSLIVHGGVGIGQSLSQESFALSVNGTTRLAGIDSTSTSTGTLVVDGGAGVSGSINVQGGVKINGGQISLNSSTGSLTVVGGVGISNNAHIGNELRIGNNLFVGEAETLVVSSEPIIPDSSIMVKVTGDLWTSSGNIWTTNVNTANISLNGSNTSIFSASNIVLSPGPQKFVKIGEDEVATKNYVDSVAQGLDVKKSVRVATTGRINVRFEGDAIPGGILTTAIDGITLNTGDRVLVKDQGTGIQGVGTDNREKNGIWIVGSTWTRASDANSSDKVSPGMFVFVEEGSTNADTGWVLINNGNINLGTTKLDFSKFSSVESINAGTNLNKVGSSLNLNNNISLNGNTASTSTATGTLVVAGGVGVSGSINARGIGIGGYMNGGTWEGPTSIVTNPSMKLGSIGNIGGYGGVGLTNATSASTSTSTGTLVVEGGVGISGCLNIGGYVTETVISGNSVGNNSFGVGQPSTSTDTGTLVVTGGVGVSGRVSANNISTGAITSSGAVTMTQGTASTSTATGTLVVTGGVGVSGRVSANNISTSAIISSGAVTMTQNAASTSTLTGTLVVTGGVGVSGNVNVGEILKSESIICDGTSGTGKFIFKIPTFSGFNPYDPSLGIEDNDGFRVINSDGGECLRVGGQGAVFSPYGFLVNDSVGNILPTARIYKTNIGNGISTTFTITHNLGTRDVMVSVYRDSATPSPGYDTINTSTNQINRINNTQIQLTFSSPPPATTGSGAGLSGGYRVVIMG